jgi:thymidylate kinase
MIIVVTGQDGAGKTTLVSDLVSFFNDKRVTKLHLPISDFTHEALNISGNGMPMADVHTDRLIFALDNRLANYRIKELQRDYDVIILQRGWMDSFIHGAVQGYEYADIESLTRVDQLISPTCSIYLNCAPDVAYERIEKDINKDKFETKQYMKDQFKETKKFYNALSTEASLAKIFKEPKTYIDTTYIEPSDTFIQARQFVEGLQVLH